jgi:hypothetical protein
MRSSEKEEKYERRREGREMEEFDHWSIRVE